jgi:dTDP-glucose 4,6-dehydratase
MPTFVPSLFTSDLDHVIKYTHADWEELRGRRLFVTGGTGFFGMWLLESFLWANKQLSLDAEIVVLSRDPAAFLAKAPHLVNQAPLSFHTGDVTSFAFPRGHFSHIIHAATSTGVNIAPRDLISMIVDGTRHTLDFALHCGAQKFLFTSSGAVYGQQPSNIIHVPEEYYGGPDILNTTAAYAESKRLAEQLCAVYSQTHGVETKISRCFAFVGPYLPLDSHFAIGNFIRDALNDGPIVVNGDGLARRSYLYAADLAIWLWTILFRGVSCRAYNTGAETTITFSELAQVVAETLSPDAAVRITQAATAARPPQNYVPKTYRARQELGLDVWVGLVEAIRRTGRWHRSVDTHS